MTIRKGVFALSLLILSMICVANGQTRTFSLVNGDSLMPASPFVDVSGSTTYFGGSINGQVVSTSTATFTLSVTFKETGPFDAVAGLYVGTVVGPSSSFAVTEISGRKKSVTTSGTIDTGTVTYLKTADGRAEIISVVSDTLTVWEGKNRRRTAVGKGTLDYGTAIEGSGTMALNLF